MGRTYSTVAAAIAVALGLGGCGGKPEIVTTCDIKLSGDYVCTFRNKGAAKGSVCEYFAIADEAFNHPILLRYQKTARLVTERFGYKFDSDMAVARDAYAKGQDLTKYIADDPQKKEPYMQVALTPEYGEADKKVRAVMAKLPRFSASQLSDHEICSGIVEAGDVRQVTGTASFKGKRPAQICSLSFSRCNIQPVPESEKQNAMDDDRLDEILKPLVAGLPEK